MYKVHVLFKKSTVHVLFAKVQYTYKTVLVLFKSTSTTLVLVLVPFQIFRDHFIWHDDGNPNEVIHNLTDENFDFIQIDNY